MLRDALLARLHQVGEAATAREGIVLAASRSLDVVICDVAPEGMECLSLQREIHAVQKRPLAFVFLSGGTRGENAAVSHLTSAGSIRLFQRPPNIPRLLDIVDELLTAQPDSGVFADGSFDALLARIDAAGESGVLTAHHPRDAVVKKVVFVGGRISFCGSNDPRELVGQFFLRSGLISESELVDAMAVQATDSRPLGKVLEALAKVTPDQVERVVSRKFRETFLDLFLWTEGRWSFQRMLPPPDSGAAVALELRALREQGKRRAEKWAEFRILFPGDEVRFRVHPERFPEAFPVTSADRKLVELAVAGKSLAEIRRELPGQQFGVYSRYADFCQMGAMTPDASLWVKPARDENESVPEPKALRTLLEEAERALLADGTDEARELFHRILQIEPRHPLALRGLAEIDMLRPARKRPPPAEILLDSTVPIPLPGDVPADPIVPPAPPVAAPTNSTAATAGRPASVLPWSVTPAPAPTLPWGTPAASQGPWAQPIASPPVASPPVASLPVASPAVAPSLSSPPAPALVERAPEAPTPVLAAPPVAPPTIQQTTVNVVVSSAGGERSNDLARLVDAAADDAPAPPVRVVDAGPGTRAPPRAVVREVRASNTPALAAPAPRPAARSSKLTMIAVGVGSSTLTLALTAFILRFSGGTLRSEAPAEPVQTLLAVAATTTPATSPAAAEPTPTTAVPVIAVVAPTPSPVAVALVTPEPVPVTTTAPIETPRLPTPAATKAPAKELTPAEKQAKAKSLTEKGLAKLDGGDAAKAIVLFKQALAADPAYGQAHLGLGTAYMLLGDNAAAKRSLRKFLQVAPGDPLAGQAAQLLETL